MLVLRPFAYSRLHHKGGAARATLSTLGVLLFIAFPVLIAGVCCLAPEMVKKSRVTRVCFTLLGAFVFTLSMSIFASMPWVGFDFMMSVLGVLSLPIGALMVSYGIRPNSLLFAD